MGQVFPTLRLKNKKTKRATRYPGIIQGLSREPWISSFCSSTIFLCHDPQTDQQRAVSLSLSCFLVFFFVFCFLLICFEFLCRIFSHMFGQEELFPPRVPPPVKIQWKSSEHPGNPGEIQGPGFSPGPSATGPGPPKFIFSPKKL